MKQRVFVLGAGSSNDYGMPLGSELVMQVIQCCSSGHPLFQKLLGCGCAGSQLTELAQRLSECEPNSIDLFLTENPGLRAAGKMSIAAILLDAEKPEKVTGGWYRMLFNQMVDGRPFIPPQVITFNYDRSFRFSIMKAARAWYRDRPAEADLLCSRIDIIDLHGRFVPLPQENSSGGVAFGKAAESDFIAKSAQGIRLATEDNGMNPGSRIAQEFLSNADEVFFLGFAFHEENLLKLRPERWKNKPMYLSGYGFSQRKRKELESMFPNAVIGQRDQKLPKFLEDYDLC